MSVRSRSHIFFAIAVLVGTLALYGCPKRPEVGAGQAGATGPSTAVAPAPTTPGTGAPGGEARPAQPTPPAETRVAPTPPPPVSGGQAGGGTAGGGQAGGGTAGGGTTAPGAQAGPAGGGPAAPIPSPLKDVFFEFDKSAIKDDQKAAMNEDVTWLKQNAGAKVTIEGHCDERGTSEYNLALGERRARTVQRYLLGLGVLPERIAVSSEGSEGATGGDEGGWRRDRRVDFRLRQ
jgi:peptidoglycan-associated lipoprotein